MNIKKLIELRNAKKAEMEGLLGKAVTEERAMDETEKAKFDALEAEIRSLDGTIKAYEASQKLEIIKDKTEKRAEETKEQIEVRSFSNYIKEKCGITIPAEERAGEQNFDMTNNGAVIPVSIANRVITEVKEMAPILAGATIFNVNGTLKIPVYGKANTTHDITVAYQSEFTDITADAGKFTSVDLTGFLAGALSLVGKSVINNSDVDVTSIVITEMARKIALFLEKELLVGTSQKSAGALSTTTNLAAGSTTAISADKLIELQAKIPTAYQANACWTMHPSTFTSLRKVKDGNGQYLLQNDFSKAFPYSILGKPVYLSDNMPVIAENAKAVLYGDYAGLAVNMREDISIQVLLEKYATMHAVGIVSWFEFDSEVMDHQKLATITMALA